MSDPQSPTPVQSLQNIVKNPRFWLPCSAAILTIVFLGERVLHGDSDQSDLKTTPKVASSEARRQLTDAQSANASDLDNLDVLLKDLKLGKTVVPPESTPNAKAEKRSSSNPSSSNLNVPTFAPNKPISTSSIHSDDSSSSSPSVPSVDNSFDFNTLTNNAQLRNFFSDRPSAENMPAIPGSNNSNSSSSVSNSTPVLNSSQSIFGTSQFGTPQTVGLPNTFTRNTYTNSSTNNSGANIGANTNGISTIPTANLNNSNTFNSSLNTNFNSGLNPTPNLNPNLNSNSNLNGYGYPYNAPGVTSNPYNSNPYGTNPYSSLAGNSTSGNSIGGSNSNPSNLNLTTTGLPNRSTAIGTPAIPSPYAPDASFTNPLAPPPNLNSQNSRTLPPGQYIGNGQINTFANP